MKPFNKVAVALSAIALMGLSACDTSAPLSSNGNKAESTLDHAAFSNISVPNDFAFSVFNDKGLIVELRHRPNGGEAVPYVGASIRIVDGATKKTIESNSTDAAGQIHFSTKVSTAIDSLGVLVYALSIPEDTLWFSNAELIDMDYKLIVSPDFYVGKVSTVEAPATSFAAKTSIAALPAPSVVVTAGVASETVAVDPADITKANAYLFQEFRNFTTTFPESDPSNASLYQSLDIVIAPEGVYDDPDMWARFVHTGAGYLNKFGYYVYNKSVNPNGDPRGAVIKTQQIFEKITGFSEGSHTGDYVGLSAYIGSAVDYQDANDTIVIAFWLDDTWGRRYYSKREWNNVHAGGQEYGAADMWLHMVSTNSASNPENTYFLGIEDKLRSNTGDPSDHDFNDVVLLIKQPTPRMPAPDFAFCMPTTGSQTFRYGFEDNYPNQGDYDFNDVVVDLQVVINGENCYLVDGIVGSQQYLGSYILGAYAKATPKANGAEWQWGFGLSLGNIPNNFATQTANVLDVNGETIIEFFNSTRGAFYGAGDTTIFLNTLYSGLVQSDSYEAAVTYPKAVSSYFKNDGTPLEIGTVQQFVPQNNPFIFSLNDNGYEIHMKGQPLTARGTNSPTLPGVAGTFQTANGLPWAIEIDATTQWPIEFIPMYSAYADFADWAASGTPATWQNSGVASKLWNP